MVFQTKKQYSWASGYTPPVKPNIVGAVMEQIEEENGSVTKEAFLDVSRPETSPTHTLFEWDNDKAAEAYRLEQSRHIIAHLRVKYVNIENEEKQVRAFINVSETKETAKYESISVVLSDKEKKSTAFSRMMKELDVFIERNKHIEELSDTLIEKGEELKNDKGK